MIVWVAIGGVAGTVARYSLGRWVMARSGATVPLGTWLINMSGSMLLGVLVAYQQQQELTDVLWHLFGVGFCGAYTTFSTFGYEAMQLLQQRRHKAATGYVAATVLVGFAAASIGMVVGGLLRQL